jgi:hypothetical protein
MNVTFHALASFGISHLAARRMDDRAVPRRPVLGAVLPDLVDLGPPLCRKLLALPIPVVMHAPLFPWHWTDGSGSLHVLGRHAPVAGRGYLDRGDNQLVSITNHVVVVYFAAVAILGNLRVFRRG